MGARAPLDEVMRRGEERREVERVLRAMVGEACIAFYDCINEAASYQIPNSS